MYLRQLRRRLSPVYALRSSKRDAGPVIVCGSTVEGEEPILLQAFVNILASHARAVLILAPRHPERFSEVAELLGQLGIRFWKRSLWSGDPIVAGVLLIDSIGELAALYSLADVAFVGGSLVPRGGHNIIEPALHGAPIIVGHHTENFRDIVSLFQIRDGVRVVGPAELPLAFMELISNPEERIAARPPSGRNSTRANGGNAADNGSTRNFLTPAANAQSAQ